MDRIVLLFLVLISCKNTDSESNGNLDSKDYSKTHQEALAFCKENNFSLSNYFLIDMSIHSGKNRFFIYDFNKNKIIDQNLVTHGSCDKFEVNPTKASKAKFSNTNDSHCSSKGKYKIGKRDYSSWGINIKYWLHGLENSNKNAVDRVVVLHSWKAVSDEEIYPNYSPLSWGCPAVSDSFMKKIDEQLKNTSKPVLLWIVE